MKNAIQEFGDTENEVAVLMANSEIAVQMGDIQKAMSILKAVESSSPYFIKSRKLMAYIYLVQLKDRRHYAKCYSDLIDVDPSFVNYKIYGIALLNIQEPQESLVAFRKA